MTKEDEHNLAYAGKLADEAVAKLVKQATTKPRIGIEVGRVIAAPYEQPAESPRSWLEDPGLASAARGALMYLFDVAEHATKRGGSVTLFAPSSEARATQDWLWAQGIKLALFHYDSSLPKARTVASLQLTHFMDADPAALGALESIAVPVLFGQQTPSALLWAAANQVLHAPDWNIASQQLKWPEQYLPLRNT